jgi:hypothetical protein
MEFEQYGVINEKHMYPHQHHQQPATGSGRPAQAVVATPKIEAQPWVSNAAVRQSVKCNSAVQLFLLIASRPSVMPVGYEQYVHACMDMHFLSPCLACPQHVPPHAFVLSTLRLLTLTQVKELWKHLAAKTVGVARVDLRRPT